MQVDRPVLSVTTAALADRSGVASAVRRPLPQAARPKTTASDRATGRAAYGWRKDMVDNPKGSVAERAATSDYDPLKCSLRAKVRRESAHAVLVTLLEREFQAHFALVRSPCPSW
jgi:hypothetical protein